MSDLRILVVEDDPFIAMDIELAITEQLGDDAEVIIVASVEAASVAAVDDLSCALLDIDVVGGKTFGVAARLLSQGTPFAFVSGSAPDDVPQPLRAVRFVRKPFSSRDIANFVKSAIAVA